MAKKKTAGDDQRREVLGILIMAFSLLIFLGLVSHNPEDFPNSGSPDNIRNWLGLVGAVISYHLFVFTIGYSCLIFPFIIFLLGWTIFLHREFRPFWRLTLYLLALALFLSTALALPQAVSPEGSEMGFRLSGNLGGFFATQLYKYLGAAGSIVVLLTFLLLFLVSTTSWSMRETLIAFREELSSLFGEIEWKKRSTEKVKRPRQRPEKRVKRQPAPEVPSRPPVIHQQPPKPEPIQIKTPPAPSSSEAPQRPRQAGPAQPPVSQENKGYITRPTGEYDLPSLDLLTPQAANENQVDNRVLEERARFLEDRLLEFDIRGNVTGVYPGPVITRYEVRPAPGVKVSRFTNVQDDLALVLQATHVRVVAPIPGKAAVGIEVPNPKPQMVNLRGVLESKVFQKPKDGLILALGQSIDGTPMVTDLTELPHLLVAGSTGSGKSVCLNAIIASFLYRCRPDELKMILIDPKKLELSLYKKLKRHHLTTRQGMNEVVVTTVDNAISVLRSLEREMDSRYKHLAHVGVRNIHDYNEAVKHDKLPPQEGGKPYEKLPYIVLIVDELADLMMTGAREVEEPIARLAQMARAVGIHLILATQRPSVDVITGVIKANFPSRIAFQVISKTDSRTILDRNGAEKLLGRGDMLFLHPRQPEPIRIHGAFISTDEVKRMVSHVQQQPEVGEAYRLKVEETQIGSGRGGRGGDRDELFKEAAKLVIRHQQGSASLLQRRLRVGYARAGRLIDELEDAGIIGPFDGSKARQVLVDETFATRVDEPGFPNFDDEGEE